MLSGFISGLPWYVNAGFALAIIACIVRLIRLHQDKSPERQAEFAEAKQLAERIASHEYFVEDASGYLGALLLTLKTADADRHQYSLLVAAKHPDIKSFRMLQRRDRLRLGFLNEPHRRLSRAEICSYLEKKELSIGS